MTRDPISIGPARATSCPVLKDQMVQHVYAFEDGLIRSMEIREQERT